MLQAQHPYCRVLVVLVFALTGCVSWRPFDAASALATGRFLPYRLRATRQDSTRVALTAPFVRADTLYGRLHADTVAVPIAEITRLERERLNLGRTLGLVIGLPVVAVGLTYLIVCGDSCSEPTY
jgi:hypothetical protein